MEIITKEVSGIATALYDMRKPMESRGDSVFAFDNNRLELIELGEKDEALLKKLGRAKSGSGHDCVLKAITVHMDITATHDFVLQYYRYSFRDTTSSTSKMHCIHKGDISEKCSSYVSTQTITFVNRLIKIYNETEQDLGDWDKAVINAYLDPDMLNPRKEVKTKKELFECIIHNTPLGYELTFGEVLNYLQLKTMYNQRKNHKMSSWSVDFVNWIKTLPMSYLITGEE